MTQLAKAQEPSMEEILASIRRIIADDDAGKGPPDAVEPVKVPLSGAQPPAAVAQPTASPRSPAPSAAAQPTRPVSSAAQPADSVRRHDEIDGMHKEPAQAPDQATVPANGATANVLDLTEAMAASAPAAGFRTIDGHSDLMFEDRSVEHGSEAAAMPGHEGVRSSVQQEAVRSLISSTTSAAVDSAFNTLAHTVLVQNARTLEDLVREMLRPMLKSWLDDNLPGLVERLVRAEIERVSRGRG
jgi:cell pole-organizing protein PopZ